MKLKKKLLTLLSFLMLSVFFLTGCSPEAEEIATDVLTGLIEAELEESTTEAVVDNTDVSLSEEETELPIVEETVEDTIVKETTEDVVVEETVEEDVIDEDGTYTSKEEVAAYLHEYGHLPSNFITKKEARKLGWVSNEGNLWEVAPGMSIGGDYFGNYEGNLPEAKGRDYYECDIDTDGSYRGAKRIVFSNDGLIYYTEDHYETFELLYGEE